MPPRQTTHSIDLSVHRTQHCVCTCRIEQLQNSDLKTLLRPILSYKLIILWNLCRCIPLSIKATAGIMHHPIPIRSSFQKNFLASGPFISCHTIHSDARLIFHPCFLPHQQHLQTKQSQPKIIIYKFSRTLQSNEGSARNKLSFSESQGTDSFETAQQVAYFLDPRLITAYRITYNNNKLPDLKWLKMPTGQ